MDVGTRVRVVASKLDHPSAQRLDPEQFERLRAEVRTLRWVVRERLHRPEWAGLIAEVEVLVERVELLDPAAQREVEVPPQARGPEERVVDRVVEPFGDRVRCRPAAGGGVGEGQTSAL